MSFLHRARGEGGMGACLLIPLWLVFATQAVAYDKQFRPAPPNRDVTITNGGLSVTFNIAWGAAVVGVAERNVAHGLSIVDRNDVGRELQPCQFMMLAIRGHNEMIFNPTQAGAEGYQPFYQHPKGVVIAEKGSPVVQWKASRDHFHAVIKPLDYDTGKPGNWDYVEDAKIDSQGVAHFHYAFYNHEPRAYSMIAIVPTLYTDRTGTFMFPLVSPYGQAGATLGKERNPNWPVKVVTGAPTWPQKAAKSLGWIANIDTADDLGIFYTTPPGLSERYGVYANAPDISDVSDHPPLAQTFAAAYMTSHPGDAYSLDFSVLVSTPRLGPALISKQPAAVFKTLVK
jgi:hypothetical protein